jgi:hypothetical protein
MEFGYPTHVLFYQGRMGMTEVHQTGSQKLQLSAVIEKDNSQTNEINAKLEDALREADTSVDRLTGITGS